MIQKGKLPAIMLLMAMFLFLASPVFAENSDSFSYDEFLGYMEQIAEDIEEIHHDMHKVSFALRLSSYSLVVIAIVSVLMLFSQLFFKRD